MLTATKPSLYNGFVDIKLEAVLCKQLKVCDWMCFHSFTDVIRIDASKVRGTHILMDKLVEVGRGR